MNKIFVLLSTLISLIVIPFFDCQAKDIDSLNNVNMHPYISIGAEHYNWDEYIGKNESKYVEEKGPRLRVKFGANNYLNTQQGILNGWDMGVMFGIVNYKGSTLNDQIDVPNDTLKGKAYYTGYNAEMTRGYRYREKETVSFDVKGALGGHLWLRNIRSHNIYITSNDKTRQFRAIEVSVQPYAIATLATNWQINNDAGLTLESGVLYPVKTWTHSNQGNVWLEPKSKISPFTSLTWHINKRVFVKASYLYERYGKSQDKKGKLDGQSVGYFQPLTITSTAGLDIGYFF